MTRFLRILLVGSFYVGFGVFGLIMTHIAMPLALWGIRDPRQRMLRGQELLHRWCRAYFFGAMQRASLARIHRSPKVDQVMGQGPCVVVANHPSLLDVVFVMAAVPRITYVAKESWVRGWLVGPALRRAGHIGVPAGRTIADGAITLQRILEALQAGHSVLVFPEGTRSPRRGLHPMHRGAFEAAVRARVPIVALVLDVTPPMLRKGQPWYDVSERPVDFSLDVLDIVDVEGLSRGSRALAQQFADRYRRQLGIVPHGSPPHTSSVVDGPSLSPERTGNCTSELGSL